METSNKKNVQSKNDDTSSTGKTEDSLVSSRTIHESVSTPKNILSKICQSRQRTNCGQYKLVVTSIVFFIFGLLQIIFPPYNLLMNFRLIMTPGLPAFEWWLKPLDEGIVKIYIFNVTNAERFLHKTDKKIKLQEIGPIVYREHLVHKNVEFNENSTLTFTTSRSLEYLPERNPVNFLNKTIVMPNIAFLFVPSYLYDSSFIIKFGVNMLIRTLDTQVFKTATINEFLWNMTDPILETSQTIAPSIVRTENVGILNRIYENYEENTTVYIGPNYGDRDFFLIDKYNGLETMPNLEQCKEKIQGSISDLMYYQGITKNDTLRFFRRALCRAANLKYARDFERYSMTGYRFEMDSHFYNRTTPFKDDCYKGVPALPNGLSDVSFCNYGSTIAASNPHFLYADEKLQNSVDGLNPDKEKHLSYVEVEPNTGIPFQGAARSQLNVVIKDMRDFNYRLRKFSNLNIPLVWIEVVQESLPIQVQWMVYIQIVVLPVFQTVFAVCTFLLAFSLLVLYVKKRRRRISTHHAAVNKALAFETEQFLKS